MATPGFTVRRRGTDSSGRAILATDFMWAVWQDVLDDPIIRPFASKVVIVQGAFMARAGGGATASAGYHDQGGCFDVRTWNLTGAQQVALIKACRKRGMAAWRRDRSAARGRMDPHIHTVLGADRPLARGASTQWGQYLRKQSGLASGTSDYEWRPSPLVTKPPASTFREDDMADAKTQAQLDRIEKSIAATRDDLNTYRAGEYARDKADRKRATERYRALVSKIGGLADQLSGDQRQLVLQILAEEQDVTEEDNPAPQEDA